QLSDGTTATSNTASVTATTCQTASVTLSGAAQCYSGSPGVHLSFTVSGGTENTFDLYRNGSLLYTSNTGTTFDNYPLTAGSTYSYYVVVHLSDGTTATSNTASVTATTCQTASVTLSGAAQCYSGSPGVHLSFTVSGGTENTFDLYRNGSLLYTSNTGTTFDNYPLTAGSTYSYYVVVHLSDGTTATSNTASVTATTCQTASVTLSGAAQCYSGSPGVHLSFTVSGGTENTFDLYRNGSLLYTSNTGTTFDNYPLTAGSTYSYYVVVHLSDGTTATSNTASVTATTCQTASVTLSGAAQCYSGSPGVHLSFTVSGGTENTFDLYRNGSLLYTSNTGTTFDNYPLTAGSTYSYYVVVHLSDGTTATSNTASVTPSTCQTASVTLSGAAQCYSGSPGVHLSFTVSGGTENTFDLYRNGSLLYPSNTGSTFDNHPLTAGNTYSYYVVVHLTSGSTATSN